MLVGKATGDMRFTGEGRAAGEALTRPGGVNPATLAAEGIPWRGRTSRGATTQWWGNGATVDSWILDRSTPQIHIYGMPLICSLGDGAKLAD